jgi:hypothetical protein
MIAKIKKGKGFRGVLNYLLRDEDCQIIGGNLGGRTARELSSEFALFRQLHSAVKKPVAHISISAHPNDRHLDDNEFSLIAKGLSEALGYKDSGYIVIRHSDTEHQHIHIVLSRIDFDGTIVSDSHDFRRAESYLRGLERAMHLTSPQMQGKESNEFKNKNKERTMNEKTHADELPSQLSMVDATVLAPQKEAAKRARETKRFVIEPAYEEWIRRAFPFDLLSVYKHPKGAVLYFDKPKKIRDDGDKLSAFGMSSEKEAAEKLVAVALAKGWARISFSGNPNFVRTAIKVAMEKGIEVLPSDLTQASLIDEIKAEVASAKLSDFSAIQPTAAFITRLQERRKLMEKAGPDDRTPSPKPFGI